MNFKHIKKILQNQNAGAILIEFAFAIPVLVSILYFIMDGPGLRLYQLKLKNSAYVAVNLIQNLNDQNTNKAITSNNLKNITFAAFGNIYRTDMMLRRGEKFPLGHYGHIYLWCVFGEEDKSASVKWVWASGTPGETISGFDSKIFTESSNDLNNTIVKFGTSVPPSYIYKDLVINPGETKMILEVSLIVYSKELNLSSDNEEGGSEDNGSENSSNATAAASQAVRASGASKLGFYLLPLKPVTGSLNSYLNYVAIFTPKPNLFNFEIPPKET